MLGSNAKEVGAPGSLTPRETAATTSRRANLVTTAAEMSATKNYAPTSPGIVRTDHSPRYQVRSLPVSWRSE